MIKIDPLFFLVLIEAAGVFFALALIFFVRSRRYRKLYDQALSAGPVGETPVPEKPQPVPEPVVALPVEEPSPVVPEEPGEPVPQNVRKLLEIIDFQKQRIMDLLCMRDMLDDAYKQLEILRQKNIDLEGRIVSLVEASATPEEFGEASTLIASNNRDLGNYIGVLQRKSISLGDKVAEWEDQMKILWEEARAIADELPEGEPVYAEGAPSAEIEALREKLQEREEKLASAQDELKKMAEQYEDIEKEYMILYSKQQAADAELNK